jgi:hypothetical protein
VQEDEGCTFVVAAEVVGGETGEYALHTAILTLAKNTSTS